ncbi:MAG: RidA family protein [Chloroflexota bacterium]
MHIEERLAALGLALPEVAHPVGAYVPATRTGSLIYTSGQLPLVGGQLRYRGKVGVDITLEEAQDAARLCALNGLAAMRSVMGDLDRLRRMVKVTGYVNCDPAFTDQAAVLNGASTFLQEVLGELGRHVRSAVGCASLPLGSPVEVEFVAECGEA